MLKDLVITVALVVFGPPERFPLHAGLQSPVAVFNNMVECEDLRERVQALDTYYKPRYICVVTKAEMK